MKKKLFLLLAIQALFAQNIPFEMDHPVYHFLERQESRGFITAEYWSTRPYSYTQIDEMLTEIEKYEQELSVGESKTLKRFQHEFNRDFENDGIKFPWSKSTLDGLLHPDQFPIKPFFMTYKQGNAQGWINWSETFRVQNNGKTSRGYNTDHLGIYGVKDKIAFSTQYIFHRVTRSDGFNELPESYKEGYILDRDYIKWINWGYPLSSLTYTHSNFSASIHRQPVYWGYSPQNSPILSDNVNPLPYIQWTTELPHLRFKFLHARLSTAEAPSADTLNTRRNLVAQRVEFDISPNFEFAFNEMVIYANRDFELGYLNPVNFLYAEEQVQGDLDNKLMALDYKWRILPGLTTYGTWFFDELNFWKLFSGWWGNKFVFQLGATYYPQANLPSLNFEYTAARPWTYSHQYPVNSYTSGGRGLGLKDGPNTERVGLRTDWQVNSRLYIQGEVDFLRRGDDPGADVLASYSERGHFEEEDESFLNGTVVVQSRSSLSVAYYLSSTTQMSIRLVDGVFTELGLKLDW